MATEENLGFVQSFEAAVWGERSQKLREEITDPTRILNRNNLLADLKAVEMLGHAALVPRSGGKVSTFEQAIVQGQLLSLALSANEENRVEPPLSTPMTAEDLLHIDLMANNQVVADLNQLRRTA